MRIGQVFSLAVVACALTYAVVTAAPSPSPSPPIQACMGGAGCSGSSCPRAITALSATFPTVACPNFGESQSGVDIFSWNEFVALNWPATNACAPDTGRSILNVKGYQDGPVVWQTQMSSEDVFKVPPATPAPWCGSATIQALFAHRPVALDEIAKAAAPAHLLGAAFARIAQPTGVEAVGGVVTDQSGRWLRYERLMNKPEYTAVVANSWWNQKVLYAQQSITLPTGSLELKSAWKVLTPAEKAGHRYYTTWATVYNTPKNAKSPGPNPVELGLVGLHIIQKTAKQQSFFWSTFEQVDNDRVFFNPHILQPENQQTAKLPYTELHPNGKPVNAPVQIKRMHAIQADPKLNAYYQTLLKGSVFANYRLISTQWETGGAPQGTPANVANITIETFVQQLSAQMGARPTAVHLGAPKRLGKTTATGCLACHAGATAANGTTRTDMSFMFLEAQSPAPSPTAMP
jgi:hypothetical protein